MAPRRPDPYETLGVSPDASDEELRAAYRRLVQVHHPDHNNGSAESERRFEEVQDAYAQIRQLRSVRGAGASMAGGAGRRSAARDASTGPSSPETDARLVDLERQVREAHQARERAREAARRAAAQAERRRPSDEELGYVTTDDSFSSILADARSELTERLAGARQHPVGQRISDLLEELERRLGGRPPGGSGD